VLISFQAIFDLESMEAYVVAPSGTQNEAIVQELSQGKFYQLMLNLIFHVTIFQYKKVYY